MTIAARLQAELKAKKITQKRLAEEIGATPTTVNTWLKSNTTSVPSTYILPICRLLDLSPEELLEGLSKPDTAPIPNGYVLLNSDEKKLVEILRELDWEGVQVVMAKAVEERRRIVAQGIDPATKSQNNVG